MTTLYGINNCDTVKKARNWLQQHDIEYLFHDFLVDGLDQTLLQIWCEQTDWNSLLNRRSTTWRNLSDNDKKSLDRNHALALMLEQPTVIKRPVLSLNNDIHIGFSEKHYVSLFYD